MIRSILRNFTALGAAHITNRIIEFLFLVYAARVLGSEVFGQYLLIGTYVALFSIAFTAGVMPVAVREIVRQRDNPRPVLEEVLSLRLLLGLLAYAMLILITALVLPAPTFLPLAALAGTALLFDAFKDSFAAFHSAFERMVIPSAFQVASGMLTAMSGVVLLYLDFGIVVLLSAGAIVNLVVTVGWHVLFSARFQRYRIRFAVSVWKRMLIMAAPVAPLQFAYQFNRLVSITMLSLVGGPIPRERAVGYFGPAQQIANLPMSLLFLLRRAMVPPIANKLNRGERLDEEFSVALKVAVVFLSFPLLVATSVFASESLLLTFGPEYLQSALALKFLGGAAALAIAAILPETFMISYPETKFSRFLPAAYVPLLINLALCLILIPIYSIAGAAFAILVARGASLSFAFYYCWVLSPVGWLGFARLLGPLAVLCGAYAACLLAAHAVEHSAWRALAVASLTFAGMLVAGHRELGWLWALTIRRARHAV